MAFAERRDTEERACKWCKVVYEERELLFKNRRLTRQDYEDGIITKEEYRASLDDFRKQETALVKDVINFHHLPKPPHYVTTSSICLAIT